MNNTIDTLRRIAKNQFARAAFFCYFAYQVFLIPSSYFGIEEQTHSSDALFYILLLLLILSLSFAVISILLLTEDRDLPKIPFLEFLLQVSVFVSGCWFVTTIYTLLFALFSRIDLNQKEVSFDLIVKMIIFATGYVFLTSIYFAGLSLIIAKRSYKDYFSNLRRIFSDRGTYFYVGGYLAIIALFVATIVLTGYQFEFVNRFLYFAGVGFIYLDFILLTLYIQRLK